MSELIILAVGILAGGLIVWAVLRAWQMGGRSDAPLIRLEMRASMLHSHYHNERPNTAREVGEALFGPEDEDEDRGAA